MPDIFIFFKKYQQCILLIENRGSHVCRIKSWNKITIHQPVKVMKQTNEESINIDPYCCKITISRMDKIGPVTVRHTL